MRGWFLLLTLLLTACGGSGNGVAINSGGPTNGGPVGDEVIILPSYGYQVSTTPAAGPLTVRIPDEGGMLGISIDFGNTLNGDVNVSVDANNNISIDEYTLQTLSSVTVNSDAGDIPFLGTFDIEVSEDMLFGYSQPRPPDAGAFQVLMPGETVSVAVINGGFSSVEISLNGGPAVSLTWDQLEGLLDDDLALPWHRRAALATEVLKLVLIQVFTITTTFNVIDDALATVNPAVIPCDPFTGTPPLNVLLQGESTLTWLVPGSVPMSGDDFHWTFTDCWFNDTGSALDTLVNGSIELNDYVEIVDGQSQLIGSGFNQVIYNNLEIAGTVENPVNTFTIDPRDVIRVSGGFDLAFIGITG